MDDPNQKQRWRNGKLYRGVATPFDTVQRRRSSAKGLLVCMTGVWTIRMPILPPI